MRYLRQLAAAAVLILAPSSAFAAGVYGIVNQSQTTSDPTKLPLAGGTMIDGAIIVSTGSLQICSAGGSTCVELSSSGVVNILGNTDGIALQSFGQAKGYGHIWVMASTGTPTGDIGVLLSTGPDVVTNSVGRFSYDTVEGDVSIGGGVDTNHGEVILEADGDIFFTVGNSGAGSVVLNGADVKIINSGILTGGALCINATSNISTCSSAVDALGQCTCP